MSCSPAKQVLRNTPLNKRAKSLGGAKTLPGTVYCQGEKVPAAYCDYSIRQLDVYRIRFNLTQPLSQANTPHLSPEVFVQPRCIVGIPRVATCFRGG